MTLRTFTLPAIFSLCLFLPAGAQLVTGNGALTIRDLPDMQLGVRLEDMRREVDDGKTSLTLEMPRMVVEARFPLLPGVSPWLEAGWNRPDLATGASVDGGLTWGAGVSARPRMWSLREDPETGPREWLAVMTDLAVRSGTGGTRQGDVEWTWLEARVGLEWHDVLLPAEAGPLGATGMTVGGGMAWNSLSAEKPGFDGSESNPVGAFVFTTFRFGPEAFVGLEAAAYGGGDRRLGLTAGHRF